MRDINVMMIGFPSSGKTSYMAAVYNRFCSTPVAGFQLKATDDYAHQAFITLGEELRNGYYPKSTDIRSRYNFNLLYDKDVVLNFNWNDYRGGVLAESSNETQQVVNDIISSDALIIFLDSTKFYEYDDRRMISIMKRIQNLMMNTLSKKANGKCFPISFVFTKLDEVDIEKMVESDSFRLFTENVIPLIRESQDVVGLFTGTIVGKENLNIEFPFIFTMCMCLSSRLNEYKKLSEECIALIHNCSQEAQSYADSGGVIDSIVSFVCGVKSDLALAEEKLNELQNEYRRLAIICAESEKLEEPLKLLSDLLTKLNEDEEIFMKIF